MTEDTKKQPSSVRIQQIDDPLWRIDGSHPVDPDNGRARLDDGVVRLNNDWPGFFLRGDSACGFATQLQHLLDGDEYAELAKAYLRSYPEWLRECNVQNHKDAQVVHGERDDRD